MVTTLVTIVHLFICVMLITIVLLQQGKGADMGAAFGAGGSNTLFGASGADNFLTRMTTTMAIMFMATSIYLAISAKAAVSSDGTIFKDIPKTEPIAASTEAQKPEAEQASPEGAEPAAESAAPAPAAVPAEPANPPAAAPVTEQNSAAAGAAERAPQGSQADTTTQQAPSEPAAESNP